MKKKERNVGYGLLMGCFLLLLILGVALLVTALTEGPLALQGSARL